MVCALVANNAYAVSEEDYKKRIHQLEKRLGTFEPQPKVGPQKSTSKGSTTATGLSKAFNPAISVNGLFLGTYNSDGNSNPNHLNRTGLNIQEVELRLSGNVDNYFRADLTLAMHEIDEIEIEEFLFSFLPIHSLSIQGGKFFTPFGKHNQLHTHQFPFIDQPLVNEAILGEEGLNEIGVGVNYLLPLPFYSEANFQILNGDNEEVFNGSNNDDFAYLVYWTNLLELSDAWTLEIGGSYAYGKKGMDSGPDNDSHIASADIRFKYKPLGRERYNTIIWQSEFINSSNDMKQSGAYTFVQYQFARRWWVQGRYGYFNGDTEMYDKNRWSAAAAYTPSEFSAVRIQYNFLDQYKADEHQAFLQLNITFGSHPAHGY
jgi:hypothetical protein